MRNLRFNHTCEHRFVFPEGEAPQVVGGDAFPVSDQADIPDAELKAQVWRIQRGAEISVNDREADKLSALKDADGIAYATSGGDLAELPRVVAPDPTDPQDRTPREEVERLASEAGHTPEGDIHDHERHRAFARSIGIEPGGPAASTPAAPPPPPPRPSTAPTSGPGAAPGRSAAPAPDGSAGAPTPPQPQRPGTPPPLGVGPEGATRAEPTPTGGNLARSVSGTAPGPNAPAPALQRSNVDLGGTLSPAQPQPQPGQANPGVPPAQRR